jgi:short-subunit dehydrogenase
MICCSGWCARAGSDRGCGMSTVLITGASSGIGEALARLLAGQGHRLVLVARRLDRLEALAAALDRDRTGCVELLPADLLDSDGIAHVEARLRDEGMPVDELVNNAGVALYGPFVDAAPAATQAQFAMHVDVPMRLMHAALPGMVARRQGGVLNIASTAGLQATPGLAAYAASKSALIALSEAVHDEVRPHGVRVTCTAPGYTRTELQQAAGVDASRLPNYMWTSPERVAKSAWQHHTQGRALHVPGALNAISAVALRLGPRRAARAAGAALVRRVEPAH